MDDFESRLFAQTNIYIIKMFYISQNNPKSILHDKQNKIGFTPFANGGFQSLLQSTRRREYIATFAESICIFKFNECIHENV